jgi:hypothetical protein
MSLNALLFGLFLAQGAWFVMAVTGICTIISIVLYGAEISDREVYFDE